MWDLFFYDSRKDEIKLIEKAIAKNKAKRKKLLAEHKELQAYLAEKRAKYEPTK